MSFVNVFITGLFGKNEHQIFQPKETGKDEDL